MTVPDWLRYAIGIRETIALLIDIWLIDQTSEIGRKLKAVETWIAEFEQWVKSLPFQKVTTWHLTFTSKQIETHIWEKHPNWIAFIVGFLLTTVLSAHSIIVYGHEMLIAKIPYFTPDKIPRTVFPYVVPAASMGGILFIFGSKLLLSNRSRGLVRLYLSLLLWKALLFASILVMILGAFAQGILNGVRFYSPSEPASVTANYVITGFVEAILFFVLCTENAIWLFDWFLFMLQASLIIWLTLYLAIFLIKAVRFVLKRERAYFVGLTTAISGMTLFIIACYQNVHLERCSNTSKLLLKFVFGF